MTTYPVRGIQLRQPHPSRRLVLSLVVGVAVVGALVWALVEHSSSRKDITLTTQIATGASKAHPERITQYSVTVREAAAALVRGMFAGAGRAPG